MKNWKTSLSGVAGAAGAVLVAWSKGSLDAGSVGMLILALGQLAQGVFAKDADVHSTEAEVIEASSK